MKLDNLMKNLRIGVFPPKSTSILDEIKTMEGVSYKVTDGYIVKILSEILNVPYTISLNTGIGESQSDGNWTGCIGMVQRGEADIAVCGAAITEERSRVVSFSYPYLYMPITFATDKPRPLPNSFAILYAFSWKIWLAILMLFLFTPLVFYMLFRRKQAYSTILLQMVGSLAEQSFKIKSSTTNIRLAIIGWIIGIMCITYSYKAVLLASYSFPNFSGIFDIKDLSEAALDPHFRCGIQEGSYIYKALMQSSEESAKRISNCVKRSPRLISYDAFLMDPSYKKAAIFGKKYLSMYKRDFLISDDIFFTAMVAIVVNKNFCCLGVLNDAVLSLNEAGFVEKYEADSEFLFAMNAKSSNDVDSDSSNRVLKLDDFGGTFVFLISGLFFSTLVLVIEIIFHRFKRNRFCVLHLI